MTIAPDVEAFLATDSNEKQPGQWRRKGVDGPPYVEILMRETSE